ncbi:hypothetical protein H2248_006313 [Termitomyces sp. 'cryptogamus']|nr:hypothetical protein H2248_006313 [Termitomyces sp. 'cryptogamus']
MSALSIALSDGACLIGFTGSEPDLKTVLLRRLSNYYARLDDGREVRETSLEGIQLITAKEALAVVTRVQQIIGIEEQPGVDQPPLIGTRDLKELSTLLSIVFRWGIDPLYAKVALTWPETSVTKTQKIIELTAPAEEYASLFSLTSDLLRLVFPDGFQGRVPQTLITTTILEKHSMDILKPCIMLGWLPRSLASDSRPVFDAARPMTMRFLNYLTPLQTITALGSILSSNPRPLPYVRKLCITLLGQQLLRPQGVRSLCAAVFGENDSPANDSSIERLQHITRVFLTVPANVKPEEFYNQVIPKIVALLNPQESATNKRAAAFVISRMLSGDAKFEHQDLISKISRMILLRPFSTGEDGKTVDATLSISSALVTLITLVSNADPSPTLISSLLSPIVSTLYSLLHYVDHVKTVDPSLRESLRGLIITWGKIVSTADGVHILWPILRSDEIKWTIDLEGNISRDNKAETHGPLSLLTPEDLRAGVENEYNINSNILGLYPDPSHFVQLLKTVNRADISSDFFVRLLEAYRDQKNDEGGDPTRVLLYLQVIMQMQAQLTDGKSSANILCKPTHLLSFIKHVLEPRMSTSHESNEQYRNQNARVNLQIVTPQDEEPSDEGDSDDDTPGAEVNNSDDEMIETSVNLLLSILEANEDLSARTAPILNHIFSLLEPLARDGSDVVRSLAKEARMVMTARLASTSSRKFASRNQDEESAKDIYQKALKLLQDPILPVRAHGLLLLRQLVAPSAPGSKDPKLDDDALVPAILSIFLQSVQDDDSYMFLNAVQGLAAMVDRFGKEVLRGLVKEYADGLDGLNASSMTQHDLDTRTRVGEALAAVIRRCGEALSLYVDIIVPPLFQILRSRHSPTTLRTSSLSLLSDCESTNPLSILSYVTDLANAMLDILQLEIVPTGSTFKDKEKQLPSVDTEPLSTNTKFPPLRRGALHFLALMMRETTKLIYESSFGSSLFSDDFIRRAKTTLGYVASVDSDDIVRVMAREAAEDLNQLNKAMLGL